MATGLQKLRAHIHALSIRKEKFSRAIKEEQGKLYPDQAILEVLERNHAEVTVKITELESRVNSINGNPAV
jgi:hypothetical protein